MTLPLANLRADQRVPMGRAVTIVRLVLNPETQRKIEFYDRIFGFFCLLLVSFRSELLEHHVENLSTPVIFLNIVMERINAVQMTTMSWMASLVVMLTVMRVDVRHMIPSAGIYLHKVLFMKTAIAN